MNEAPTAAARDAPGESDPVGDGPPDEALLVVPGRPAVVAHNLRRLMARDGMTYEDVVARTGLDTRTLRGILRGERRPHARTLTKLAEGMGVSTDELFAGDPDAAAAEFDSATNPAIEAAVDANPSLFTAWTPADFGELVSRFGVGGELTIDGVLLAAQRQNANRRTLSRARVVLESDQATLLRGLVDSLYERAAVRE
ncbi:MAG: helix-turn-helix domain-containing protein [Lacipirellulaceae bacterium]